MSSVGNSRLGAVPDRDGTTAFTVWAPAARAVAVRLGGESHELERDGELFAATLRVTPGEEYVYVLDGGRGLPDPCSRFQPQGIHGPSRVVELPPAAVSG